MDNCIFCKIINGDVPSSRIFEDGDFLAFLTIEPVKDGHILVIPKKHINWMEEADDKTIGKIFQLVKKLMSVLKKAFQSDYVEVVVAGEEVPHFHIHLIPRNKNDDLPKFPIKKYKEGEAKKIAEKIVSFIP